MRSVWFLGCAVLLAACSGEPEIERLEPVPEISQTDFRQSVTSVTSTRRDRVPGGVIFTATGVPPTQGWWDAELVPLPEESSDTRLAYEFRLAEPFGAQPPGAQRSREVVVGLFLSDQRLQGVREIVIRGANNTRSIRP